MDPTRRTQAIGAQFTVRSHGGQRGAPSPTDRGRLAPVSPGTAAVGALCPVSCDFSKGTFARRLEESPQPFQELLHGLRVGVAHPRLSSLLFGTAPQSGQYGGTRLVVSRANTRPGGLKTRRAQFQNFFMGPRVLLPCQACHQVERSLPAGHTFLDRTAVTSLAAVTQNEGCRPHVGEAAPVVVRKSADQLALSRTAWISSAIWILRPRPTPPPSSGVLNVMPKSSRLISAVAENPRRESPNGVAA